MCNISGDVKSQERKSLGIQIERWASEASRSALLDVMFEQGGR